MTEEEQKLNWYAIMESGSMTAIHNIREYIKQLEKENNELQKKYDELNDFSNSQCAKLLKENAELKVQITNMHKCLRCMSNDRSIDEEPCKNCLKDGIYTNWH